MKQAKLYIQYDGRAEYQEPDDCSIYQTAESRGEAQRNTDMFPDGVWFEYDIAEDGKTLTNPTRIYLTR